MVAEVLLFVILLTTPGGINTSIRSIHTVILPSPKENLLCNNTVLCVFLSVSQAESIRCPPLDLSVIDIVPQIAAAFNRPSNSRTRIRSPASFSFSASWDGSRSIAQYSTFHMLPHLARGRPWCF
ncbi:unnamed protein product [Ectocarpus sp. 12 AP-2014]